MKNITQEIVNRLNGSPEENQGFAVVWLRTLADIALLRVQSYLKDAEKEGIEKEKHLTAMNERLTSSYSSETNFVILEAVCCNENAGIWYLSVKAIQGKKNEI